MSVISFIAILAFWTCGLTGLFWFFIRKQDDAHEREITRLKQRMSVLGRVWGDEK